MSDWSTQRDWEQVAVGTSSGPIAYPLSLYRLVALRRPETSTRSITTPRTLGGPGPRPRTPCANTMFLQGMWERVGREYVGLRGRLLSLRELGMRAFAPVGSVAVVRARVADKWLDAAASVIELELRSEIADTTVCGPGSILAVLPRLSISQKGTGS